jgi:hypothetical protein
MLLLLMLLATGIVAIPARVNLCDPNLFGVDLRLCPMKAMNASEGPVELRLMPMKLETPGRSFMTRAYAGKDRHPTIPGPVIYMKQNTQVGRILTVKM